MTDTERYVAALRKIANINNGPDRASGEYRCIEAARIAADALNVPLLADEIPACIESGQSL